MAGPSIALMGKIMEGDNFNNYVSTVLPPNSRFLGPGIFREFEIHELIIHHFPPNSPWYD